MTFLSKNPVEFSKCVSRYSKILAALIDFFTEFLTSGLKNIIAIPAFSKIPADFMDSFPKKKEGWRSVKLFYVTCMTFDR